jgi:hypothetical protein
MEKNNINLSVVDTPDINTEPNIDNNNNWLLCCSYVRKEEIVFFSQLLIIISIMAFCMIQITRDISNRDIYFTLMGSCTGYMLPAPTMINR